MSEQRWGVVLDKPTLSPGKQTFEYLPAHDYSDACPCSGCSRARRQQLETRTGHATDQGSR